MEETITKTRNIWSLRAIQMLGETRAAQVLRGAVPERMDEFHLVIPQVRVKIIHSTIVVEAERLPGTSLLEAIYQPQQRAWAIQVGALIYKALYLTPAIWLAGRCLGVIYQPIRRLKASLWSGRSQLVLSVEQSQRLHAALKRGTGKFARRLVHGDLHAGNILVDFDRRTISLVDLELAHLGSPAVDFSALWSSYYLADPQLGRSFYHSVGQLVPEVHAEVFLHAAHAALLVNTLPMIHKGQDGGNLLLVQRATELLHRLLEVRGVRSFFSGQEEPDAAG